VKDIFEADLAKRAHLYKLPPADFDPMLATDRTLANYGLPPRPSPYEEPEAFAFWGILLTKPLTFIEPKFKLILPHPELQFATIRRDAISGPTGRPIISRRAHFESSRNWSGLYLQSRPGRHFVAVNGAWRVPTPNIPSVEPIGPDPALPYAVQYRSSTWVGLNGHRVYPHVSMPQSGTRQYVSALDGEVRRDIAAWWQWWSKDYVTPEVEITNMPVQVGDHMLVSLRAVSPDEVIFIVKNQSTGLLANFLVQAPANSEPLGSTAEWIVERPTWPESLWPHRMPHLTDVDFTHCHARSATSFFGCSKVHQLEQARLIRMYEAFDAPYRSVVVSVPEKISASHARVRYRGA
jgi:hypothetical protein